MNNSLIENAYHVEKPGDFPPHVHNCYEIIFVQSGILDAQISERKYVAIAPCLIFISKLEQHSITVREDVYCRSYLCISPTVAGSLIRNYTLLTVLSNRPNEFRHVLPLEEITEETERIFSEIISEKHRGGAFSEERQSALLYELLILLYRKKPSLFTVENEKSVSVIWQIQYALEEKYQYSFSLGELAESYHMSRCYLSHLFKKITGYSIMQYLVMCRMSAARGLLADSEKSITEIVYLTGFSDCSNFSRIFKREIGMTPLEYRRSFTRKNI